MTDTMRRVCSDCGGRPSPEGGSQCDACYSRDVKCVMLLVAVVCGAVFTISEILFQIGR